MKENKTINKSSTLLIKLKSFVKKESINKQKFIINSNISNTINTVVFK